MGECAQLREAVKSFAAHGERMNPDMEAFEQYQRLLERYREATDAVGPIVSRRPLEFDRIRTAA